MAILRRDITFKSMILLFGLFTACKYSEKDRIVIIGSVKNVPDGKIYLVEAHTPHILLDSSIVTNGNFELEMQPDSAFIPFLASLLVSESNTSSRKIPLIINTSLRLNKVATSFETAFILEKGTIKFDGDMSSAEKINIKAGRETEIMYELQGQFGYLPDADLAGRARNINKYKTIIEKYPFSFFLLRGIAANKEQYSKQEILTLFAAFNNKLQNSSIGIQIREYVSQVIDEGEPYPKLILVDSVKNQEYVIDSTADVNMLVFWASWCGPCRKEIPELKKISKTFDKKQLRITSISIDHNFEKWKEALKVEDMSWPQLYVAPDSLEKFKAIFRFSSIPAIILTDRKRVKIYSINGYDSSNFQKIKELIQNNEK